ncbi:UDP-4-amino-4,6-dideoxy-N-acetyl-beta-L-altrosamine N-acetyltransferase [Halomonas sp. ATCH28]|uniref:UDP-4-amino-4, 6-dideoxy-N-acetyl-beta-L-altrosamine N-acetyltransferase n=1 Tax=Halomonas gemina TaxID=2945105 RepID=A0ABT0SYD3_9GAMM|nr:UDP-4-amino-4,6-dideoxy-N-acetyl-beta-L-altrosamine N-acetyltransferase [Halomonas gemina]MCL7939449.1 UDP-4-amino-4,6-dideoxy-N-acetyl-beta-L-altrosamine N-acetyltransferase [Halomonas gemina]
MTADSVHLRPLQEMDLERIRTWRNHPEVRRFMYTQHAISADEHHGWFQRARNDPDRHLMIVERQFCDAASEPFGFVNLHVVDTHARRAVWGFYLAPEAPRGSGRALGEAALVHAFATLKLHKLCGEALASNDRSIRFHQRLGFEQEARLRDHHFDGRTYHDVIGFGLLAADWQPRQGATTP